MNETTIYKTVSLRLPLEIYNRLDNISKNTYRTKTFYIKESILKCLEDFEDYYEAISILNDRDDIITEKEMWKRICI